MSTVQQSTPPRMTIQFLAMPLILMAAWLLFAVLNPQFLSPRNLSMLMIELSVTATLAFGMLLIILPGHIDLSAGSGVGLLGGLAGFRSSGGLTMPEWK